MEVSHLRMDWMSGNGRRLESVPVCAFLNCLEVKIIRDAIIRLITNFHVSALCTVYR